MRVTQSMLNTQMLRNLNSNLGRLEKLQNQMSTGRKINKPSDDPVGISFSLRYRNSLEENEQYQRNVDSAISWVEHSDKMIGEANNVLQRTRELAIQGANGSYSTDDIRTIAAEIDQLYNHLISIGNSQFNGKYVFNGQMTDVKPYEVGLAETQTTNMDKISLEVGIGITIPMNVSGSEIFGAANESSNAFQILAQLRDALLTDDKATIQATVGLLDERMNTMLEKWASVGAKANRIDLIKNRLESEHINITTLLSNTEDADMAELMIKMKTEENVYQASLSTGARIIRPSLVDFMR